MCGWLKLHRDILDWEWYSDVATCRLFTHLLLKANYKATRWRGIALDAGQLVTGRRKLAEQTGLSEQQVRTALKDLQSTNDITINSTNKFSIITVSNWDAYQSDNQQSTNKITSSQPASNQQSTTDKEINNIKNNNINTPKPPLAEAMAEIWNEECGDVLSKSMRMPASRKVALEKRLREEFRGDLNEWRALCRKVRGSPFLTGNRHERGS